MTIMLTNVFQQEGEKKKKKKEGKRKRERRRHATENRKIPWPERGLAKRKGNGTRENLTSP